MLDLYYADDAVLVPAHGNTALLVETPASLADAVERRMANTGLNLSLPKFANLVVSPGAVTGEVFRRVDG